MVAATVQYTKPWPLRKAALTAGIGYLLMMCTPFCEFYAFPKLVVPGNAAQTISQVSAHEGLLRAAILGYLINFVGDLLALWSLYYLLRPVHSALSAFTALLRFVYTMISLVALLHLLHIPGLLQHTEISAMGDRDTSILRELSQFRSDWSFGYIFFGFHLILLGWLCFRSHYIPKWIGIFLALAGFGWLLDNLRPIAFPSLQINFIFIMIAGLGELVFMIWLLVRGRLIQEPGE